MARSRRRAAGRGRGASFEVRFPLIKGDRAPKQKVSTVIDRRRRLAHARILVVDDNRDSARTMAKILELDGHSVVCAYDGRSVSEQVAVRSTRGSPSRYRLAGN